jgi:hypothetical protein
MKYDYYRKEITDTIDGGVDDHFRVKVFGKVDSKHLNVTVDQLRNLADAMDETNPPSLLPLLNGARVIQADVEFDGRGVGNGYVIAEHDEQLVVWRVWLHKGQCRWLAETGDYCGAVTVQNMHKAIANYNDRRRAS